MSAVTYIARRSLIAGHDAGETYSIDLNLKQMDRSVKPVINQSTSLSGATETLWHRNETSFSVATVAINDQDVIDEAREFLDSVCSGEEFSIDIPGTSLVPVNPVTVRLDGDYSESMPAFGFTAFTFKVVAA